MLCGVVGAVGLELVQVQPLQQLAVDPQLQVGHDRAEVGFQLGAGDGRGFFGLEGEREGPDPHLGADVEDRRLAAQHLFVAHHATVEPHVLQVAACRRCSRTTACRRETSGLCSTTLLPGSRPMRDLGSGHVDHERRLSLILLYQIFMGRGTGD